MSVENRPEGGKCSQGPLVSVSSGPAPSPGVSGVRVRWAAQSRKNRTWYSKGQVSWGVFTAGPTYDQSQNHSQSRLPGSMRGQGKWRHIYSFTSNSHVTCIIEIWSGGPCQMSVRPLCRAPQSLLQQSCNDQVATAGSPEHRGWVHWVLIACPPPRTLESPQ